LLNFQFQYGLSGYRLARLFHDWNALVAAVRECLKDEPAIGLLDNLDLDGLLWHAWHNCRRLLIEFRRPESSYAISLRPDAQFIDQDKARRFTLEGFSFTPPRATLQPIENAIHCLALSGVPTVLRGLNLLRHLPFVGLVAGGSISFVSDL
jgi:hypothetical protein